MKKQLLTRINCVLGAVSVGLAGCGSVKSTPVTPVQQPEKDVVIPLPSEPEQAPSPDEPTPVKYGSPYYEYGR